MVKRVKRRDAVWRFDLINPQSRRGGPFKTTYHPVQAEKDWRTSKQDCYIKVTHLPTGHYTNVGFAHDFAILRTKLIDRLGITREEVKTKHAFRLQQLKRETEASNH